MPMKLPAVHWRDFQRPDCEVTASHLFFFFSSQQRTSEVHAVFFKVFLWTETFSQIFPTVFQNTVENLTA